MSPDNILKAAALLEQRTELATTRSWLRTKPSAKLGVYTSVGDDTMYSDTKISNANGIILVNRAIQLIDADLDTLGVEETADLLDPTPPRVPV